MNDLVVFSSLRNLDRAENIKSLWDAYDGNKMFVKREYYNNDELKTTRFPLVITDEFLPDCISPMIMIYHGIAGGKTYGLDAPRKYHKKATVNNYRWFITSSEDMVEFAAKQSGAPIEKILPLGMPRTDAYVGKKKGDGGIKYTAKKVYLYAPTFNTLTEELTEWREIGKMLTDDEILIVKNHPISNRLHVPNYDIHNIVSVSKWEASTPYLIDCDVLITDYSSIMFDAMVLDKPVVLFEKDWGSYSKNRGMYFPYPHGYSTRHATKGYELIKLCREAYENGPGPKEIENKKKLAGACDGHSIERIIDLIKKEINDGERERSSI